jgi:hypothetical protein
LFDLLLSKNLIDINYEPLLGSASVLALACRLNNEYAVEKLIKRAEVSVNSKKISPLYGALRSTNFKILSFILSHKDLELDEAKNKLKMFEKKDNSSECFKLLSDYCGDPMSVRARCFRYCFGKYIVKYFTLCVMFSDDYLTFTKDVKINQTLDLSDEHKTKERRFFLIVKKLPIEIQYIISACVCDISDDVIRCALLVGQTFHEFY